MDYYRTAEDFKGQNGYIIDNLWYPRVTRIVSIKAKPGLENFYREVGGYKNGQAIAEKSADEGTLVHETAEALLLGQAVEIPSSIAPAIAAFQNFANAHVIKTEAEFVERRIYHADHRYAGTVDALVTMDGKFGVLDIKTSQSIYRDYNLQTAAYMDALTGQFPHLETRWILRLDQIQKCANCSATLRLKGGREKIRGANGYSPYGASCENHEWLLMEGIAELKEFPFWGDDFEAFLGAKKLWEWENSEWLKRVGYL
jgi:hypothetical protein